MISSIPIFLLSFSPKSTWDLQYNCFVSCWKTADSCSRPTCCRTCWQLTMCKQCSVKRRECQNRSNRRWELAKSFQIVARAAGFMGPLLMLQTTQLPSRSLSISWTKHEVLFFINPIQILNLHPSSFTFHCSLWRTLCMEGEVSGAKGMIEYLVSRTWCSGVMFAELWTAVLYSLSTFVRSVKLHWEKKCEIRRMLFGCSQQSRSKACLLVSCSYAVMQVSHSRLMYISR